MEGGGWRVEGGGWRVEGGGWRVEGGGWGGWRADGGWRVEGGGGGCVLGRIMVLCWRLAGAMSRQGAAPSDAGNGCDCFRPVSGLWVCFLALVPQVGHLRCMCCTSHTSSRLCMGCDYAQPRQCVHCPLLCAAGGLWQEITEEVMSAARQLQEQYAQEVPGITAPAAVVPCSAITGEAKAGDVWKTAGGAHFAGCGVLYGCRVSVC
jgi:hypothetical protein